MLSFLATHTILKNLQIYFPTFFLHLNCKLIRLIPTYDKCDDFIYFFTWRIFSAYLRMDD